MELRTAVVIGSATVVGFVLGLGVADRRRGASSAAVDGAGSATLTSSGHSQPTVTDKLHRLSCEARENPQPQPDSVHSGSCRAILVFGSPRPHPAVTAIEAAAQYPNAPIFISGRGQVAKLQQWGAEAGTEAEWYAKIMAGIEPSFQDSPRITLDKHGANPASNAQNACEWLQQVGAESYKQGDFVVLVQYPVCMLQAQEALFLALQATPTAIRHLDVLCYPSRSAFRQDEGWIDYKYNQRFGTRKEKAE